MNKIRIKFSNGFYRVVTESGEIAFSSLAKAYRHATEVYYARSCWIIPGCEFTIK